MWRGAAHKISERNEKNMSKLMSAHKKSIASLTTELGKVKVEVEGGSKRNRNLPSNFR